MYIFIIILLIAAAIIIAVMYFNLKKRTDLAIKERDMAEATNKLRTAFIQNLSHDIRTPLSSIVGFAQMLTDEASTGNANDNVTPEQRKEYARLIKENVDLLLKQVDESTDIALMKSDNVSLNFCECRLNWVCNNVVEISSKSPLYSKENVTMSFTPHNEDYLLNSDQQRLNHILMIFLTNAAKFTKKGSIVLDYKKSDDGKSIIFSVTDTGVGVPEDRIATIFNRYEDIGKFEQGTGLDLYVSRLIAESLGGSVSLDTEYHGGSRFLFAHPIK